MGAHLAKKRSISGNFLVIAAVGRLAGGASDGSFPLNRSGDRNRTLLIGPSSQMLPSLVRARRVKERESRVLGSEDEFAGHCGSPC